MTSDIKPKHNRLLVLDFDHTVFDTTAFVAALREYFHTTFGVDADLFMREREAVKNCCVVVDVDIFVRRLSVDDVQLAHDHLVEFAQREAGRFVFPDVVGFLERHTKMFDMLLLTHGDDELQRAKITGAQLPGAVPFVITKQTKGKVLQPYATEYEQIYFVDDKLPNLMNVKEVIPAVKAYFLKRPNSPYAVDGEEGVDQMVAGLDFTIV